MKYALFSYIPKRLCRRATFEQEDIRRMILGFKDGKAIYSQWAAKEFAKAMGYMKMSDVTLVCIPASTRSSNIRRWKTFSQLLCEYTGATDSFGHIEVLRSRKRAHTSRQYELASCINQCIRIDVDFFKGRKLFVIDDIYTTGKSSAAFVDAMKATGATVALEMFLAKTVEYYR